MITWRDTVVRPDTPVIKAVRILDEIAAQVLLIADKDDILLGTLTDGDVRRAILAGKSLEGPIVEIANTFPKILAASSSEDEILKAMQSFYVRHLPLVDKKGRVVGIAGLDSPLSVEEALPNRAVIMAGGKGTRLYPLTRDLPKPMIELAGRPILELIVEGLVTRGITHIYLSVHYRAEIIKDHFGDGSRFGVTIEYLEETKPLGTAGALRLLPDDIDTPILMMNGDVLTKANYRSLIDFHNTSGGDATIAVRSYDIEVPYGVVTVDGDRLTNIEEKPTQSFLVNAGVYILESSVLANLPPSNRFDMTDLIVHMHENDMRIDVFPLREYWLDIGHHNELQRARNDVGVHFAREKI
mgnify:CR=1 FL=1|tara:strand:- start:7330 stop:8394 length:1065 start_codon:yes stop_codon:yes gene_type:complete